MSAVPKPGNSTDRREGTVKYKSYQPARGDRFDPDLVARHRSLVRNDLLT